MSWIAPFVFGALFGVAAMFSVSGYIFGKSFVYFSKCLNAATFFSAKYRPDEKEKKRKDNKIEETTINKVLFFPDAKTYAGDAQLSREVKATLYKEILNHSEPLIQLVEHLSSAKASIDLCLYILTCHKLSHAVIERMLQNDVKVRLIVDENTCKLKESMASQLQKHGAFVKVLRKSDYLMHHKFAIIDGKLLLSGSFNWTMQAAMGNHENVIVTNNQDLLTAFNEEFNKMWQNL